MCIGSFFIFTHTLPGGPFSSVVISERVETFHDPLWQSISVCDHSCQLASQSWKWITSDGTSLKVLFTSTTAGVTWQYLKLEMSHFAAVFSSFQCDTRICSSLPSLFFTTLVCYWICSHHTPLSLHKRCTLLRRIHFKRGLSCDYQWDLLVSSLICSVAYSSPGYCFSSNRWRKRP